MKLNEMFPSKPSKYLKASDLQKREVTVNIKFLSMEETDNEKNGIKTKLMKPVLYFQGKEKGLMLNKTNGNKIAHFFGDDSEAWMGRTIVLYVDLVDMEGKMVEAIRIKVPSEPESEAIPF